jgi:hypothetical protein
VPHGRRLLVPLPPENFSLNSGGDDKNDEHQLHLHSEEQQPSSSRNPEFCPSLDSYEPHKITEIELNDLIRDLELPKNKAELLASRLQQWNLLDHAVKVTVFYTQNKVFEKFHGTEDDFTVCKDADGLLAAMSMRHVPEEW